MKRVLALFGVSLFAATLGLQLGVGYQKAAAVAGEITYDATNTDLSGDDDATNSAVPIGFTFNFYQANYTSTFVNINGTLNFNSANASYTNNALPQSSLGKSVLAFWDDIITYNFERKSILYKTVGSPGSRKFIVQWTNMYFYSDPSLPMGTFQAILYEGSNKVQIQYRDLLGGSNARGSSATIGINKDGSVAKQYSSDADALTQEQAISFVPGDGDDYTMDSSATYDPVYLSEPGAPGVPVLVSPSNSATNVSRTPTLDWNAAADATSYRVLISENPGFSSTIMNRTGITATDFSDISFLDADKTYYWKVEAVNAQTTAFSETRSFTTGSSTGTAPDPPALNAPANNATNQDRRPTLSWTAATLANSYRVYISKGSDFSQMVYDQAGITGLSYTPPADLEKGVAYYWKVESYNANDSTFSSGYRKFTVRSNAAPAAPANIAPTILYAARNVTAATLGSKTFSFTLSDSDTDDTVKYRVQIATSPAFSSPVIDYTSAIGAQGTRTYMFGATTGGSYAAGSNATTLATGQDYYVRFAGIDNSSSQGAWTTPSGVSFTLVSQLADDNDGSSQTVEVLAPNNGDANGDGEPDSEQENVTSVMNSRTNTFTTLQTDGCSSNSAVSVVPESTFGAKDNNFVYPAGLLNFTVSCGAPGTTATITQYYYGVDPTGMVVRKFNTHTNSFTTVPGASVSSVTIGGQQAAKVVYAITDGSELDEDGIVNGVIIDPAGLAKVAPHAGAPNTGLQRQSALLPAVSIALGLTLIIVARRYGRNS